MAKSRIQGPQPVPGEIKYKSTLGTIACVYREEGSVRMRFFFNTVDENFFYRTYVTIFQMESIVQRTGTESHEIRSRWCDYVSRL